MALYDSNSERRNLTVLSLSIIIFYLADGEFINDAIRLQIINVHFNNPAVLAYLVWIMLIWFLYRYWVTNQNSWKEPYCQEMTQIEFSGLINRYVSNRFQLKKDYSHSYFENKHWVKFASQGPDKIVFQHLSKNDTGTQRQRALEITTILDKLIVLCCSIFVCFKKPTLTGYFVPYFLCALAVLLGVINAQ